MKLKRIVSRTIGAIAALIALLALGGLFLPQSSTVANTKLTVLAPQQALYDLFSSHDGHRDMWTNTARKGGLEPMSFADMEGPDSGVGTRFCFCPGASREGTATGFISSLASGHGIITEATEPSRVVIEIDWSFMDSRRVISLNELANGAVEVGWEEEFILSNPLLRYIPLFVGEIDFTPPIETAVELVN